MKTLLSLACILLSMSVSAADCRQTARGRTICANGEQAASYNSRTNTAHKTEQNSAGVNTTQTSKGGEAKTKNGKGVVQGANGTTCVKTANKQTCN